MHRIRLQSRAQLVEQCLGEIGKALDQGECRGALFGQQSFRKNQFTTTLRRPGLDRLPGLCVVVVMNFL